jgi:hypothetical protein
MEDKIINAVVIKKLAIQKVLDDFKRLKTCEKLQVIDNLEQNNKSTISPLFTGYTRDYSNNIGRLDCSSNILDTSLK